MSVHVAASSLETWLQLSAALSKLFRLPEETATSKCVSFKLKEDDE